MMMSTIKIKTNIMLIVVMMGIMAVMIFTRDDKKLNLIEKTKLNKLYGQSHIYNLDRS